VWLGALGALAVVAFLAKLSPLLILVGAGLIRIAAELVCTLRRGTSTGTGATGLIFFTKLFLPPHL